MKEFDIVKAMAGAPVCTRGGDQARIICWDANNSPYPIIALVTNDVQVEIPYSYTPQGFFDEARISSLDLMMV